MSRHRAMPCSYALLSLILCPLAGCVSRAVIPADASIVAAAPPARVPTAPVRSSPVSALRFVDIAPEAGLHYRWTISGKRPLTILHTIGNGCAFLDYDQDGHLDILLVGPQLALYRNESRVESNPQFRDVTQPTGLARLSGHFLGCAVGDYDNDGYPDLYISAYRGGVLLHNEDGSKNHIISTRPHARAPTRVFRDATREVGPVPQPWGTSCGFADLNEDGFLDLYVANYVDYSPQTRPQFCLDNGILTACGPRMYRPLKGTLYLNQNGRRFQDATQESGAGAHNGKGLGVAFADYEGSGHISFAVANDETTSDLFQNRTGGWLCNVGIESGMAVNDWGAVYAGMGIDWGDYDNDGRPDLFVTTFHNEPKSLFHNNGNGTFTDMSQRNGIARATLSYLAFGTKFLDTDNDGWLDILIANGHVQDNIETISKEQRYRQPVQLLRNEGGAVPQFTDVSRSVGLDRLASLVGRGLAIGDFDDDGRLDALVVDSEGGPVLLHNESRGPKNGWVGFRLIGRPPSNRDAYGAMVTVVAGGRKRVRQCHPGGSYLSSSDPRVHFGLGNDTMESVTVRWPDGRRESWRNVPQGRYLLLEEGRPPR